MLEVSYIVPLTGIVLLIGALPLIGTVSLIGTIPLVETIPLDGVLPLIELLPLTGCVLAMAVVHDVTDRKLVRVIKLVVVKFCVTAV